MLLYLKCMFMKVFALTILFFLIIQSLKAQDEKGVTDQAFQGTRFVNEQSVNLADKGELILLIQHRFGEIDGGFYELFGLDQATMRLGFEYGAGKNLNIGIGRSSFMKTYDAFVKARFATQDNDFPLTIAAVVAGSLPTIRNTFPETEDNFSSKAAGNIQLLLGKTFGNVGLQVSPGFLSTGYIPVKNQSLSFFTLGLAGSAKISDNVSANIEYLPYFHSSLSASRPLSLGVDIKTGGHLFQLVLSNSQQFFTRGLYTSTSGDWGNGSLFLGFNLIRKFRIKYY